MKKTLQKIIGGILLGFFLGTTVLIPAALALPNGQKPVLKTPTPSSTNTQTPPSKTFVPSENMNKFEVQKYLKVEGQDQSYLADKQKNPIGSFIVQAINLMVLMIGTLCFLSIVAGGFVLVISNGDENMTNKGKDLIKYAIIGLAIVLCSYIIVAFVQSLFYELPTA